MENAVWWIYKRIDFSFLKLSFYIGPILSNVNIIFWANQEQLDENQHNKKDEICFLI